MNKPSLLITGCSSGIGLDAAHRLRDHGWRVFASCRAQKDCQARVSEGFESPLIDYRKPETIADGLAEVLSATDGRLDGLFNNGAFACPGAVEDLPTDALRDIFEVNFFGWHELTRQVIPTMRTQGHGRIVQCSSILGFIPARLRGAYVATKFALEGLTDVMRIEMRGTGIHVSTIEPGPITSRIRENAGPHFEKWINTETSVRDADYLELRQRLYRDKTRDPFELAPKAVSDRLIHALESKRPKPRYYVTAPTYAFGILKRVLSTRQLDWIISKG